MSADRLNELIQQLDLNSRYNLRRTSDRSERLRQFLASTHPIMAPPQTGTQGQAGASGPTQQQMYMIAQSTRNLPAARFTGYVPLDVPNRDQLMSYDVHRWLCDAETRCHVKGITDDVLKIKEAKLFVATDVGDASVVLNTGRMNEIRSYATFKKKCLTFWRTASERDRYHALSDFLSVEFDSSLGIFAGNMERARTRVLQDLEGDTAFEKGNAAAWQAGSRKTETLVALDDVINYFSWGVLFKAVPPSHREALRKVDVKYDMDYLDILSSVQSELVKLEKGTKIELSAHTTKQYTNSNVRKTGGAPRSTKCYRCEKSGHLAKDCQVAVKCNYCHRSGHIEARCYRKQRKAGKSKGGSSSSHVVDTSDPPDNNGSN